MQNLLAFVIVGFGAQLVDGALGMAFGVTASTLLLVNGLTPALASASVHLCVQVDPGTPDNPDHLVRLRSRETQSFRWQPVL